MLFTPRCPADFGSGLQTETEHQIGLGVVSTFSACVVFAKPPPPGPARWWRVGKNVASVREKVCAA